MYRCERINPMKRLQLKAWGTQKRQLKLTSWWSFMCSENETLSHKISSFLWEQQQLPRNKICKFDAHVKLKAENVHDTRDQLIEAKVNDCFMSLWLNTRNSTCQVGTILERQFIAHLNATEGIHKWANYSKTAIDLCTKVNTLADSFRCSVDTSAVVLDNDINDLRLHPHCGHHERKARHLQIVSAAIPLEGIWISLCQTVDTSAACVRTLQRWREEEEKISFPAVFPLSLLGLKGVIKTNHISSTNDKQHKEKI